MLHSRLFHSRRLWFDLSDKETEEAIIDSTAMRRFLEIDISVERAPGATTLLRFRHLLEKHNIGEKVFQSVKGYLEQQGLLMRGGSIIDATINEGLQRLRTKVSLKICSEYTCCFRLQISRYACNPADCMMLHNGLLYLMLTN